MDGAAFRDEDATASVLAPAKINLSLHVIGRREDGYHLLDGLVVFAEIADRLSVTDAGGDGLTVSGPMAGGLADGDNILIPALAFVRDIAARRAVHPAPVAMHLQKLLPVAAGIGGGSSDAAALLRWFAARHPELRDDLRGACAHLGADVPMCMDAVPCRITGIGDAVEPVPRMPALAMVLVNPGTAVSTPAVFRALGSRSNAPPPPLPAGGFDDAGAVVDHLRACRNDLEAPATGLCPSIAEATSALYDKGARLARMSGSGATVFALFASTAEAAAAAASLRAERPGWWVQATASRGTEDA